MGNLIRAAMDHDNGFLELASITDNDPGEERQLMKHTTINYTMLVQIYHYL